MSERIVYDTEKDPWSTSDGPGEPPVSNDPWGPSEPDIDVMIEGDPRIPAAPTDDPYAGVSRADLIAKVEAEAAEKAILRGQADQVGAMQRSIEKLGEAPTALPPQSIQQGPSESDAEFGARLKESFFEDPLQRLDEYAIRKFAPILQQQSSMIQSINRTNALNDPTYGETYRKHASEIDNIVASRADRFTNPEIYKEVGNQILVKNLDEIVSEKVAAALAAQAPAPTANPSRPPAFTETTGRNRPAPPGKPAVLTKAQAEEARILGMTPEDQFRSVNDTYRRSR